jgi:hypothetical protein
VLKDALPRPRRRPACRPLFPATSSPATAAASPAATKQSPSGKTTRHRGSMDPRQRRPPALGANRPSTHRRPQPAQFRLRPLTAHTAERRRPSFLPAAAPRPVRWNRAHGVGKASSKLLFGRADSLFACRAADGHESFKPRTGSGRTRSRNGFHGSVAASRETESTLLNATFSASSGRSLPRLRPIPTPPSRPGPPMLVHRTARLGQSPDDRYTACRVDGDYARSTAIPLQRLLRVDGRRATEVSDPHVTASPVIRRRFTNSGRPSCPLSMPSAFVLPVPPPPEQPASATVHAITASHAWRVARLTTSASRSAAQTETLCCSATTRGTCPFPLRRRR